MKVLPARRKAGRAAPEAGAMAFENRMSYLQLNDVILRHKTETFVIDGWIFLIENHQIRCLLHKTS